MTKLTEAELDRQIASTQECRTYKRPVKPAGLRNSNAVEIHERKTLLQRLREAGGG